MTTLGRIGLGTAQFGFDYGISNRHGRPAESEIAAILAYAIEAGVRYIDTAAGYDDAEVILGRLLPPRHAMRIVTKTQPVADQAIEPRHARQLSEALQRSRDRLKAEQLYGLLLHHVSDLAKPGAEYLVEALLEAKTRGLVSGIGVSVYDADELGLAERQFAPDLVQLPLNVLDRRLLDSGSLARLKGRGAEIHARSVFLQGLLLMEPLELPDYFMSMRSSLAALRRCWEESALQPLAGCLAFVLGCPEVDAVIVGVNRRAELEQIAAAAANLSGQQIDLGAIPAVDPIYFNPSRWPARALPAR
jgi:aryl-alcohol dehydrogenase-like predicted oxidoreductase